MAGGLAGGEAHGALKRLGHVAYGSMFTGIVRCFLPIANCREQQHAAEQVSPEYGSGFGRLYCNQAEYRRGIKSSDCQPVKGHRYHYAERGLGERRCLVAELFIEQYAEQHDWQDDWGGKLVDLAIQEIAEEKCDRGHDGYVWQQWGDASNALWHCLAEWSDTGRFFAEELCNHKKHQHAEYKHLDA